MKRFWTTALGKTLRRWLLGTMIALLGYNGLLSLEDLQLGPLTVAQTLAGDVLQATLADRYKTLSRTDLPTVLVIELDDRVVDKNPPSYAFHRGELARVLQGIAKTQPKAIFIDLDLRFASNEGGQPSKGDRELLDFLQQPHPFHLLLTRLSNAPRDSLILGQKSTDLSIMVCFVSPRLRSSADGKVRGVELQAGQPLPAALVLHNIALSQPDPCTLSPSVKVPTDKFTLTLRDMDKIETGFVPKTLWGGLQQISGLNLEDELPQNSGGIVLIGRTDRDSQDLHFTALGRLSGLHIHAQQLMTLLAYPGGIQRMPWFSETLLLVLLASIAWLLRYALELLRWPWRKSSVVAWGVYGTLLLLAFFAALNLLYEAGWQFNWLAAVLALMLGDYLSGRLEKRLARGQKL